MSHPDYRQTAHDHSSLLILVRHLGSRLNSRTFSRLYERISRQSSYRIKDSSGNVRTITARFVKNYPVENNEWGDFQTHRKVLGLISIGECTSTQEVGELCRIHESLRLKFNNTLYDSRCLFLGLQHDGTPYTAPLSAEVSSNESTEGMKEGIPEKKDNIKPSESLKYHNAPVEIPNLPSSHAENQSSGLDAEATDDINETRAGPTAINFDGSAGYKIAHPTRTLYYPNLDKCLSLESDLQDFISSLFWVLESKRLVAISNLDKEKQVFLCAPFERKDLIGMDLESRLHKKRSIGRWRKQIGDLTFQAGLIQEALEHYQMASEILRPVNDWLWLAGAFEGLCAVSVILLYPHLRRSVAIQRIGSLTGEFTSRNRSNSSGLGAMRSLPPDLDSMQNFLKNRLKYKHALGPDEIIEKFHEAVVHYSKYRNAGVIETEASIKAVHVLIEQRKYLAAAEFLQNVVFINLQLSDEEKVQRFTALSELYNQLGFARKSAFFRRVSAMRCVAPMASLQPNWHLCYQLLLESIDGYKLSLDPVLLPHDRVHGWAALQVQILQELTGTARRLGNVPLAIRHAALLIHLLLMQQGQGSMVLSSQEQSEMAKQLEHLSQRSETPLHTGPLALENGTIIPPISLTMLPKVLSFTLLPPDKCLEAQKLVPDVEANTGPFLFTPIQFGSCRKQPGKKFQEKIDFSWVEGSSCEVAIQAVNLCPFELKITNMQLVAEDVEFEAEQSTFVLPPAAESNQGSVTTIVLSGVPRGSGTLKIVGYSMVVLGLKNQCKLKNLFPAMNTPFYSIQVIPALPRLQIQLVSPTNISTILESDDSVTALQLYAGQSAECNLTLVNTSSVAVEYFNLELLNSNRSAPHTEVFSLNDENLKAQLPWQSGSAACVTVYIYGACDFIMPADDCPIFMHSADDGSVSLPSWSGPPSIFSRFSNTQHGSPRNKAKRAESVRSLASVRSGNSSVRSGGSSGLRIGTDSNQQILPKTSVAHFKLQYSGGPGYLAGFSRSSSVALTVDIFPSLIITKWDVLPAETPTHCYLVLDVFNATSLEMELDYGKHIIIEAFDTCRIPVPVERCPLSKLAPVYMKNELSPEEQLEEISSICSEHLISLVDLKWQLNSTANSTRTLSEIGDSSSFKSVKGKASLGGLRISAPMLDLLHMSPIQFALELNNESWPVERAEISCVLGDTLNVGVTLFNALQLDMGPLNLQVSVFQDMQNGTFNRRLDARVLSVGSDNITIDKVDANKSFRHDSKITFFSPGIYKLDIVCFLLSSISNRPNPDEFGHRGGHKWKFVPSIDITVRES